VERNRLIDGWRGLCVMLVIIGHLVQHRFRDDLMIRPMAEVLRDGFNFADVAVNLIYRVLTPLPGVGVDLFFLISGYLITANLIHEDRQHGRVHIAAFYVRRAMRILPAFYLYLLTVFVLSVCGYVPVPIDRLVASALFLCNLPDAECTWTLGHTWSLAVEEQFYLVWPALLLVFGKAYRNDGVLVLFVCLLLMSLPFPAVQSFGSIAVGAVCALHPRIQSAFSNPIGGGAAIAIAAAIIFLQPLTGSIYSPTVDYTYRSMRPALLALVFFGSINGLGPFGALIAHDWIRRIGLASYSLYLWQQLSTGPPDIYKNAPWLMNPAVFVVPALLSRHLVERPMIRWGRRLSRAITSRQ